MEQHESAHREMDDLTRLASRTATTHKYGSIVSHRNVPCASFNWFPTHLPSCCITERINQYGNLSARDADCWAVWCSKLFKRADTDWELDAPKAIKLSHTIQIIQLYHADNFFFFYLVMFKSVALIASRNAARINYMNARSITLI